MIKNSQRLALLSLAIFSMLLLSNCRSDDNYLFTMDYDLELVIQPGLSPFGGIHGVILNDIPSQINAYLATNGISEDQITKITSGSARISAIQSNSDYGFIERVEIYIAKPNNPLSRRLAFERLAVPQNTGQQLELLGSLVNSKEFLIEDLFEINFEIRLRNNSPGLINTRLQMEFRVHTD